MADHGAPLHAKVLTVSDGVVHGTRDDASGRALVEQLTAAGFEVVELPALDLVAAAIHHGTMDDCDVTYQALLAWIDEHGYRALGYSREQDIDCGPDRAWIVELQLPVERVAATA